MLFLYHSENTLFLGNNTSATEHVGQTLRPFGGEILKKKTCGSGVCLNKNRCNNQQPLISSMFGHCWRYISDIGCIPGSDVKMWISHAKKNTKNLPTFSRKHNTRKHILTSSRNWRFTLGENNVMITWILFFAAGNKSRPHFWPWHPEIRLETVEPTWIRRSIQNTYAVGIGWQWQRTHIA